MVSFQGQVPFIFVGTQESTGNAKILLEYNLDHLKVHVFHSFEIFVNTTGSLLTANDPMLTSLTEQEGSPREVNKLIFFFMKIYIHIIIKSIL